MLCMFTAHFLIFFGNARVAIQTFFHGRQHDTARGKVFSLRIALTGHVQYSARKLLKAPANLLEGTV